MQGRLDHAPAKRCQDNPLVVSPCIEVEMFFLTLPKGERSGNCRINGQSAEFCVTAETISFRYDGETEWQQRRILDSSENGKLVQYFCDDGQSGDNKEEGFRAAFQNKWV